MSGLDGCLDVDATGKDHGLVGDDADDIAVEAGKTDDHVFRPQFVHLEEAPVVHDGPDDLAHVVGFGGIDRDQCIQLRRKPVGVVERRHVGWVILVVGREIGEQFAHFEQALGVVLGKEMADAALLGMDHAAAQHLEADVFLHDGSDDFGAGDEHVGVFGHKDEVGQGRRIDCAAGAGAEDDAELRDDAGGFAIGVEDARVAAEAVDAFLDTCTAGIIEGEEGAAILDGHIHGLDDLVGVHLTQGAAHDGGVLRGDKDLAPVDLAEAGDDAVAIAGAAAIHVLVIARGDERIDLDKGAGVEEQVDALLGGQTPFFVLSFRILGAACGNCLAVTQFFYIGFQNTPPPI